MRFIEEQHIFISKVSKFEEKNKKILDFIATLPNNDINDQNQTITKTDWNIENSDIGYFNYIEEDVAKHIEKQNAILGTTSADLDTLWYQQYETDANHGWHTHNGAHFSNVYFVECEQGQQTEFKNMKIDVEKGDLISFPAFLPHRSKRIISGRKTVIAFNTIFHAS